MIDPGKIATLLKKNRPGDARKLCEKACRKNPRDPDAWFMLAAVFAQAGDMENVIRCCGKSIEAKPGHIAARYNRAVAYQALSRYAEAAEDFGEVLKLQPTNDQALTNLALVARALGNPQEAVRYGRQALEVNPSSASSYNNLGLALKDLGELEEAGRCFDNALRLDPGLFQAYLNRALTLAKSADTEAALSHLHKAIELKPDFTEAWCELANIHDQTSGLSGAKAIYQQALDAGADPVAISNGLGLRHIEHDDSKGAIACFEEALSVKPNHVETLNNLGTLLHHLGDTVQSVEYLNRAVHIKPEYTDARINLGLALLEQGQVAQAREQFTEALRYNKNSAEAYNGYGFACHTLHNYREAVTAYRTAVALKPDYAEAWQNLAGSLRELDTFPETFREAGNALHMALQIRGEDPELLYLIGNCAHAAGQYQEAIDNYTRSLAIDPDHQDSIAGSVRALERIGKFDQARDLLERYLESRFPGLHIAVAFAALAPHFSMQRRAIEEIEILLESLPEDTPKKEAYFALGTLYDSLGDYAKAFRNYAIANSLSECKFDADATAREFRACMDTYTPEKIRARIRASNRSDVPIFILGMPRSGTSLIEQIISSHPQVYGAGELQDIGKIVIDIEAALGIKTVNSDDVDRLTRDLADKMAARYLDSLARYSNSASHVSDKMPHNFMALGLIDILFPGCHVIHCKRDPVDTCLSIYFHHFNENHPYASDLTTLGIYYQWYEKLMSHWNSTLRVPICNVRYEDVVNDPEAETRRIVEFCGLEWNDQCLRYYESKRLVTTPSYDQVRRPVYDKSVARWKNYEADIKPLIDSLKRGED